MTKTLLLLLTLPWAQTGADVPAETARYEDWLIERLGQTAALGGSHTIEIHNPWGDVRCRPSEDDGLLISGIAQRHQDDPRQAELRVASEGGRMTIEVVYPDGAGEAGITAEMAKRRVDLTVIVPGSPRLVIRTDKGLAEAKVGTNDLDVATTTGDVVVATAGAVQARSEHGAIQATLKSDGWASQTSFETVTGNVSVWLPPDADVAARLETSGLITTDYSIDVRRDAPGGRKTAVATIGAGEHALAITTVKGDIHILQSRW